MKGIINNINEAAIRLGHKAAFKLKKASPEILLIGGIACVIGGTIMACKATRDKTNDILEHCNDEQEVLKANIDKARDAEEEEKIKAIVAKDIKRVKLNAFGKLIGVYAPSAAVIGAGTAMIFTSHGIMRKRNGVLLASYNALDAAFRTYRQNVLAEDDGKERDTKYLLGEPRSELSEDEEKIFWAADVNREGYELAETRAAYDMYTFEFSRDTSDRFSSHRQSNLNVIREVENWACMQLKYKGYLCLNDVLYELHMDPVPWGQLVGWIWKSKIGDNYVEIVVPEEFVTDNQMIMKFNCDGIIWDKL